MTLTCTRALTILGALRKPPLNVEVDEIEELLAQNLAVEADPEDLKLGTWLEQTCHGLTHLSTTQPEAVTQLNAILAQANKDLASDWYRMTTGRAELARREAERVEVRRLLGYLGDPGVRGTMATLAEQSRQLARGATYVPCPALGIEGYALTQKGAAVARAIEPRLARFAEVPLKTFLASWSKVDAKMQAFAAEVRAIDGGIGFVKKNRHQVVIGLAKTGLPSSTAVGTYTSAHHTVGNPSDAVTCARNAEQFGGPKQAAQRLQQAENALRQAGFPNTQLALGAAKSLLMFDPIEKGMGRFVALKRGLDQLFGRNELNFKRTARLMPAAGGPSEVLARVSTALQVLARHPGARSDDAAATAVAVAAMVKSPAQLEAAVVRLRDLAARLSHADLATAQTATDLALECLACPGSTEEVVATVRSLAGHVGNGERSPANVAIAAAFAKRFAV